MKIQHQETGSKGEVFVEQENERVAEMTYSWAGEDKFIIDHTWVSELLRGQHVGRQLLDVLVNFARDKGVKILPLCPFPNRYSTKIHLFMMFYSSKIENDKSIHSTSVLCNFNM